MRVQGTADSAFDPLVAAFERVLHEAPGGAALALYHHGRKVVDVWGGRRDAEGRPWERDTATVSFSTTKGVASTILHQLVDRGALDYDDRVATHWPAFAANGKGDITVRDVLTHRAGLYDVRGLVETANDMLDWKGMLGRLERAAPGHRGPRSSYHALTYGHLVGALAERVTGTPFPELVRAMIGDPLGLEGFHVGAPEDAARRAARLVRPKRSRPRTGAPRAKKRRSRPGLRARLLGNFRDALEPRGIGRFDFSSPEVLAACIPAANGLFTARDLAKLYAALAEGGELEGTRLLSRATLGRACVPHETGIDRVLLVPLAWRLGYHRLATIGTASAPLGFAHYGYGGSGAFADPTRHLAGAFVVNYGHGTPLGDLRVWLLNGLALRCADREGARGESRRAG